MRGVVLTVLLAAGAWGQTRLQVAPGSSCDGSLRRELGRLSGASLVESSGELKASLSQRDSAFKLRVVRGDGSEALERALAARDCAEAAFAAAVVIDRYLHELGATHPERGNPPAAPTAVEPPARPPRPPPARADTRRAAPPTAGQTERAPRPETARPSPESSGGATPAIPSPPDVRAATAADERSATAPGSSARTTPDERSATAPGSSPRTAADDLSATAPQSAPSPTAAPGSAAPTTGPPAEPTSPPAAVATATEPAEEIKRPGEPASAELTPAPEPAATAPPAATVAAPRPAPLLSLSRVEVAATTTGWAPAPSTWRPAFGAQVGVLFRPSFRAALDFLAGLPEEKEVIVNDVDRGTMSVQSFEALASVGYCLDRTLRPCGSLVGGARLGYGSASGDLLFHTASSWQARPTFGLSLQLAWLPWRFLYAALELVGLVTPVGAQFELQGVPSATVSFPTFDGLLRLSIGASFARNP